MEISGAKPHINGQPVLMSSIKKGDVFYIEPYSEIVYIAEADAHEEYNGWWVKASYKD